MSSFRRPLLLALLASVLAHGLLVLCVNGGVAVETAPPPVPVIVKLSPPRMADVTGPSRVSGEGVPRVRTDAPSSVRQQVRRVPARPSVVPAPAVRKAPVPPIQAVPVDQPVARAQSPLAFPAIVAKESSSSAGAGSGAVLDGPVVDPIGGPVDGPATGREVSPDNGEGAAADSDERRRYRQALKAAAQRFRRYPALARERGWEGTVDVALVFDGRASAPEVSIVSSSGRALLDEQALAMLTQAVRAAPMPEALKGRRLRIELPVTFSLADE
jgi:protein TonB